MITPYHIKVAPTAQRQFQKLSQKDKKQIMKFVSELAINPRPPTSKKIKGMTGLYCEEVPHARLIYKIEEQNVLLLLIK